MGNRQKHTVPMTVIDLIDNIDGGMTLVDEGKFYLVVEEKLQVDGRMVHRAIKKGLLERIPNTNEYRLTPAGKAEL